MLFQLCVDVLEIYFYFINKDNHLKTKKNINNQRNSINTIIL